MYILGLNAFHWDSSACIIQDEKIVAACEEERFNRIKHWSGLPLSAIDFCLKAAGIDFSQVDHVTIGHDPRAKISKKILYGLSNMIAPEFILKRLKRSHSIGNVMDTISHRYGMVSKDLKAKFHHIEHHRSHMASAFFISPFPDAAILSIDAFGDFSSQMTGTGHANRITVLDSISFPHSLGMFYTAITQYLGFFNVGDEYKVMGLAPYGSPQHLDKLQKVIRPAANGKFKLASNYFTYFRKGVSMEMRDNQPHLGKLFSDDLVKLLGPARQPSEPITQYHKDLASSVQKITEEMIFHVCRALRQKSGLPYLCMAGGVAQNSVANGKIAAACDFEQIYVPPAGHDAGLSIGSALYVYNQILGEPRPAPLLTAYLGSSFSNEEIIVELKRQGLNYQYYDDALLFDMVSEQLINNGVVGWFSGKAEFGPRALGARSILADPRNAEAKQLLNSKIKRRESFRPFAPSVLNEYAGDYFELNDEVPFMEKVFPVKENQRKVIPAVTHVDGSGRLQTVVQSVSPRYYQLIDTFFRKTGVPILLNTSFNENEPIVNSPREAIDCYLRTKMDMLVLENCVLKRS